MKKGLIYKIIYGKDKEKDFSKEDLPKTRRQQVFLILKTRFALLFKANLYAALFWLPLIVWDLICGWYVGEFTSGMEVSEKFSYLINLTLLRYGTDAILLGIAAVGLAGVFYVARRILWGFPVKVGSDFLKGIKNSYKQFFGIGFFLGAIIGIMEYFSSFSLLTMTSDNSFVWTVSSSLCVAVEIIACISAFIACGLASLYNIKFSKLIVSGIMLTFKKLFSALGVFCVTVLPFAVLWALPWVITKLLAGILIITVGLGYSVMVQTAFCLNAFDVYINKTDYPDFVAMGLSGGKNFAEIESEKGDDINSDNVSENTAS